MKRLFKVLLLSLIVAISAVGFMACKNKNDDGAGGGGGGGGTPPTPIEAPLYNNESRDPKYNVYNGITVDGVVSLNEWDKYDSLVFEEMQIGGVSHYVEWGSTFSDEGVVFFAKVLGSPAYYNPERLIYENSGVELFLAPRGETSLEDGKTWEIELFPNGEYGSHLWSAYGDIKGAYRRANCDIDIVGTVDGELNSPQNNGYTIEWMIPWLYLGLDEAPAYVNADLAVMYCPSYTGKREAWVSLRNTYGESFSWTNPYEWYAFTKDGVFDENGATLYTVNGNTTPVGGSIEVLGSYKDGTTVVAKPENGYQLKSLKVNGVQVNALSYSVSAKFDRHLDIEVEFKPIEGNPFTFVPKAGYAYTEKLPVGTDVPITLVGDNGIYAGITDEDGKAIIYAPDGDYSVIIPNYNGGSLTLNYDQNGDNVYEIVLVKGVLATTGTGATLTDNESASGATLTGVISDTDRLLSGFGSLGVDFSGKVILDYVYGVDGSSIACTFIRWSSLANTFYNNQVAWQSNKLILKEDEKSVKEVLGTGIIEANIIYVVEDNKVACYLKTGDVYEHLFTNVAGGKVTGFSFESVENRGTYYYKNIKVYDGVYAENYSKAIVSATENPDVTTTISKENVSFGDIITFTASPNEGDTSVMITGVTLNGNPVDYSTDANGVVTYTFTHLGGVDAYNFAVNTIKVNSDPVEFTVKHKFAYLDPALVSNGVQFTILGTEGTFTGTVNNGKISIKIPDGVFTISGLGYASTTITVENGYANLNEVVLLRQVISHYGSYGSLVTDGTNGANGGSVDFGSNTSVKFVKEYFYFGESVDWSKLAVIEYDFTLSNDAKIFSGIFFRSNDKLNTTRFGAYFNQGSWAGSNINIRHNDNKTTQYVANADNSISDGSSVTIKVVCVSNGTTVDFYVINKSGVINKVFTETVTDSFTHVMTKIDDHESGSCKWTNVKIYDGNDATVKLTELGIN